MYAEESVELLRNSGIQFEKHEQVYKYVNMTDVEIVFILF